MPAKKAPKTISVSHINVRVSISFLIIKLLLLEFIAASLILIFALPLSFFDESMKLNQNLISAQTILFVSLIVVKSYLTFIIIFQWLNEYYEIKPTEIIYRKGFIFHKIEHFNYIHVKSIGFHQGLMGTILNFGTIYMYDWYNRKKIYLYLIHNPKRYFQIIESLIPTYQEDERKIREHMIEAAEEA